MKRVRLAYKVIGGVIVLAVGLVFLLTGGEKITPIFAGATTSDPTHPTVTFTFDGRATTIAAAFSQAGLAYHPADHLQVFPPDIQDGLGGVIVDTQALPLSLTDGTKNYTVDSWATTVGGLLQEQNIILGDQDKIEPTLATPLTASTAIVITRVAVTQVTETGPIPFSTVKQDDPTLNKGLTKVKTPGQNGVMSYVYQDTRENGVTVKHVLLSQTVATAPVSEVDLIGTKPVITVRCAYNDTVIAAALKYGVDPNLLCNGMMIESNGHATSVGNSAGGPYYGLFQYTASFWAQASTGAGYAGADWSNATAQINVTAWAIAHGYASRWFWA